MIVVPFAFPFVQTQEIVVDESRRRNVPFTLIREKGTYGTVTVNFEVGVLFKYIFENDKV